MLQNSVITADFSVAPFMGASPKSTNRGIPAADDTFMNILNERITARNNDRSVSVRKTGTVTMKDGAFRNEVRDIKSQKADAATRTSGTKASETGEIKAPKEVESDSVKEDRSKEEIEEEIETLEALIALLEELLAKLEAMEVQGADPGNEMVLNPEAGSLSPMELLMALAEGNIEKLKTMVRTLGEGEQNPEISDLADKIKALIEKLEGSNEKDFVTELLAELVIEKKDPAHADVINELKAKCQQLIQRLREQVSKLKDSLPKNPEGLAIEQVLPADDPQEPEKVIAGKDGSKSQADSKDTGEKPKVSDQGAEIQTIYKDGNEDFEKLVVQNNQSTAAPARETQQAEKTPLILSKKPLEQLVTNQVVMKVKLMAGENRQEMEMKLKPESLGKLSLKIIHERGEILARITAENEQVKEILESNMQLLRDALEKNGFSVQSLSVSVSNDREENPAKEEQGSGIRNGAGPAGRSEMKSSAMDMPGLRERIEKEYYGYSSRINLTA